MTDGQEPVQELEPISPTRGLILTIGVFDGVHRGHRHLAHRVVRRARKRGCLGAVITFHPHPRAVLTGEGPSYLTTLDERLARLHGLGLDVVTHLPFSAKLARLSAFEFMARICRHLRLRELWVGYDFALGRRRQGTADRLAAIGEELGYRVYRVPPLTLRGQTVSSTRIRGLIHQGEVGRAAYLLGRPYRVGGEVIAVDRGGGRRPRPTARVVVPGGLALPADGSYACRVRFGREGSLRSASVTAGPAGGEPQLEVRSPGLTEDAFGQALQIEFIRRAQPGPRIAARIDAPPRRESAAAFEATVL